jgi:uncharacterized protein (DUF1501 family)
MWEIVGSRHRLCDGINRRNFVKVGALASMGLTLADLLRYRAQAAAPASKQRSAILIFLAGGPSHFETFDPKPDAPAEVRGPYTPIATAVPGLQISDTLPQLAQIADKFSLIRSCAHDNSGHGGGQRYVQTGYKSASLEEELPHDYPAVGSIVAKVRGPMRAGLPTYMHLPNGNDGGPAYLGAAYQAFSVYSNGKPVGLDINGSSRLSRLDDRRALRRSLDTLSRQADSHRVMDSLDTLEQHAFEMLSSSAAHEAFEMRKESEAIRKRYGEHDAGKCCLLARRFIEAGAGLVSVRIGSWDHHGNAGGTIKTGAEANCPPLDQALSALITDLHDRGLRDDVLVWVWGEFGRTPRINKSFGRDHWPQAMSVLLSGGGIQPGRVIGATSKKGEYPIDRAVSPADVLASVYRQLGIDPSVNFMNAAGRPIPILSHGTAIAELV